MPRFCEPPIEFHDRLRPCELDKGKLYTPALFPGITIYRYNFQYVIDVFREYKITQRPTFWNWRNEVGRDVMAEVPQGEPFMFIEHDHKIILPTKLDDDIDEREPLQHYKCMKVIFGEIIGWTAYYTGTSNYCFKEFTC